MKGNPAKRFPNAREESNLKGLENFEEDENLNAKLF